MRPPRSPAWTTTTGAWVLVAILHALDDVDHARGAPPPRARAAALEDSLSSRGPRALSSSALRPNRTKWIAAPSRPPRIAALPSHFSGPFQSLTASGIVGLRGRPYSSGWSP